ncbi:glycosyltransferase [Novosphingobium sp.]|uniref:glycosyltransferase n=1 Tax=Novosphingobium sp. TaxID=1874826 RepID=UPI0025D7E300|nr:glycosyltransferase [Novosphingobium sp.]
MNRVLIVSLNFPPSTIASVHRARHLAKHLPAHGWQPRILTIDERFHKEPPDPGLAALVPADVDVVRLGALPYSATRWLGIGDLALRSLVPLKRALDRHCASFKPHVVLITGWPFYEMLLTRHLRKRFGVPVVLDFQDPWVSAEGATRPRLSKGGLAHLLARTLEPFAVRPAAWITSVSDTQNAEMAARYPWFNGTRMTGIPIGGDPEDFDALRVAPPASSTIRLDPAMLNLCYVGTFLPRAGEVVRALFKGAALFRAEHPDLAKRVRFVFVGTSNQPAGAAVDPSSHRVMPIAADEGVADMVEEHPPRVPYLEALALQANAHAILMLGSDEPHYTASKIYPGMMSGRPFLSIFHAASSAHRILSEAGGGVALGFGDLAELAEQPRAIALALERLATSPQSLGAVDPLAYAAVTADAVSQRFADVFEAARCGAEGQAQ